jgi:ribonuclease PH
MHRFSRQKLIQEGGIVKRNGNRRPTSLRKIKIKRNFIKYAEGSCLIEAGDTKVTCTASVVDGVPIFLRNQQRGWITAEYGMLPRSCRTRVLREASRGRLGGRTQEIQRLIGRCMRSVVDMRELGERTIWVDCDVIQADGGTRCLSITGSYIALCDALGKMKKDGLVGNVAVKDYVAAVSVGIIDGKEYLDLNYDEDTAAEVDMNVVMTGSGEFIEIQGTAEKKPFERKKLDSLLLLAKKGIKELITIQKSALKK